jgi:hypothetical protein
MDVILSLSHEDLGRIAKGERLEVHSNVFVELTHPCTEGKLRGLSRTVRKSTPVVYEECPRCKGKSFAEGESTCCYKCEGSGRLVQRAAITVGDTVVIKDFIMEAWGWFQYPKPQKRGSDRAMIPDGTTAIAVDVPSVGHDHFIVDCVIDDTLYRFEIEGQYVRKESQ